jgi:hypothetical protein
MKIKLLVLATRSVVKICSIKRQHYFYKNRSAHSNKFESSQMSDYDIEDESRENLREIAKNISPHQYMMAKEHMHQPDIFHTSREAHTIYERKLPEDDIVDHKFKSGALHHPSSTLLKSMQIAHVMAEQDKKHHQSQEEEKKV